MGVPALAAYRIMEMSVGWQMIPPLPDLNNSLFR